MATVLQNRPQATSEGPQQRVHHPLERLRGAIRSYVVTEGALIVTIFLALWFWVGLLLDYGAFKLFTIDWVQELPRSVRWFLFDGLTATLAGLMVVTMAIRLVRRFRDDALALVLERRFPDLLGDRLITAVELVDPQANTALGFSQSLVDQTVREAAERVEELKVHDVFDWQRLRRLAWRALGLTGGILLAVGALYCANVGVGPAEFASRFGDVAGIWFERNILMRDTIWPRQAYLELVDFPGNEIKVGRDAQPPTLRVRALKWILADADSIRAPEGWRALKWADLSDALLNMPVPHDALPEAWKDWTVDCIELELDRPGFTGTLPAETVLALRNLLERLDQVAASPAMSRQLRKLEIPDEVEIYFKGATTRNNQTLQQGVLHEYSGTVSDLRESVRFTVRGKDYYTPYRKITVVPPPSIISLTVDEAQPAYLYHRIPRGGTVDDLRHQKQHFRNRPLSLNGDTTQYPVPSGTDLVLTAVSDKPLQVPGVRLLPGRKGSAPVQVPVEQPDPTTFRIQLDNLTTQADIQFEFTDTDGVIGRRRVVFKPTADAPPEVDVQVEVIRRSNQGYLVTPQAQVPFSGKVRDDRGLDHIDYAYTVTRLESPETTAQRLALVGGVVAAAAIGRNGTFAALTLFDRRGSASAAEDEEKNVQTTPLTTFERVLRDLAAKDVPLSRLQELLEQLPGQPLLREYNLDPDFESFGVDRLGLLVKDDRDIQPHYRLRLWVTATDNNIETGPRTGQSKEKFTLLVVSENELLAEIAKEEETLHTKLEEAVNRLKDAKIKLDKVAQELPDLKPEEFSPMARRAEELDETISKSWDVSREVNTDYLRILKELKTNRVQAGIIAKVNDKICEPLDAAINGDFPPADESMRELQKKLDAKTNDPAALALAREQLDKVINRLNGVLDAMADVATINKIIEALVKIKKAEEEEYERLKKLLREKEEDLLNQAGAEEPKKEKEKK
jgi:hypothetical protein